MADDKKVLYAEPLNGRLLFFGGVYSNLQSLAALKTIAEESNYAPQNMFCTGDIIGYCAQPNECIDLIKAWGIRTIAGNVELQLRDGENDCGCDFNAGGRCDIFSKNWYAYAQRNITNENLAWLQTIPHHIQFSWQGKQVLLVHGSWFRTAEFIFKSTDWTLKEANFNVNGADIIVAGHCGLPFAHEQNEKLWLNPGVIGMPANDGSDKVWYATLQEEGDALAYRFHRYCYDFATASRLILENGLPASYAKTLNTGLWDNCEILPAEEAAAMGREVLL